MLSRIALRAIRPPSISNHPRHISPIISNTSLRLRTYAASSNRPPRPPPPPPASSKPRRPPPPPQAFPSTTGQARQTSPGTSFPKDKTWKPQDGIKLGGPAAATAGRAGKAVPTSAAAAKSAETPVDGMRPVQPAETSIDSPLEQDAQPQEPIAQKMDADEPIVGGVRDMAHQAQAASENTPPPPEPPVEPQEPQKPLPDLRQGLPSTFDIEFGKTKEQASQEQRLDLTEQRQQRSREEQNYDRDRSAYETSLDRRRAQMANYLYATILLGTIGSALYLSRPFSSREDLPPTFSVDETTGWSPAKMYARLRARAGSQMGYYTEPTFPQLLPDVPASQRQPFTLVLSLEDLMIHSTWTREHGYRTAKRPGIDYFIRYLSQYYELVLFTSVPITMADPVIRKLDPHHFMWPLGREATKYDGGEYVKDLAYLNRPLNKTLIIDTHAPHVKNQPENAIIIPKWSGDPKDPHTKDLVALIPFLEYVANMSIDDVRPVLKSFQSSPDPIPAEFARREALAREEFVAQRASSNPRRSSGFGSLAGALGMKGGPAPGTLVYGEEGKTAAEGLREGKMPSDQIREQGQRGYEFLEKQIREHGEEWLKEEQEEQRKAMEVQVRDMKRGAFSWFGGSGRGGRE